MQEHSTDRATERTTDRAGDSKSRKSRKTLMAECMVFFRERPVFDKVFRGFQKNYHSYGRFAGTVVVRGLSRHCIIHEESLASKHLKMNHVMQPIIKIVNFIRSRGLNHRQFRQFLEALVEKFSDVPYFTEVRWLSR